MSGSKIHFPKFLIFNLEKKKLYFEKGDEISGHDGDCFAILYRAQWSHEYRILKMTTY
jgi:hypothetical protein